MAKACETVVNDSPVDGRGRPSLRLGIGICVADGQPYKISLNFIATNPDLIFTDTFLYLQNIEIWFVSGRSFIAPRFAKF